MIRRREGHAQSVIRTGDFLVNLDAKTAPANGQRVHLTGHHIETVWGRG